MSSNVKGPQIGDKVGTIPAEEVSIICGAERKMEWMRKELASLILMQQVCWQKAAAQQGINPRWRYSLNPTTGEVTLTGYERIYLGQPLLSIDEPDKAKS